MSVAVVIPTRNRPETLAIMLKSILIGTLLPDEIVVVDQSQGLETKKIIVGLKKHWGIIRYIADLGSGTSHAKNLGWHSVKSKYVAFTDDDAYVDLDWLKKLVEAIETDVLCGLVGGKIVIPNLREYKHIAFPENQRYLLPCLDFGDQIKPFPKGSFPVGVNTLTRFEILRLLNGFNEDIGPNVQKRSLIFGEDTDFAQRVQHLGYSLLYAGEAIVNHPLIESRNTECYYQKRIRSEIYTHAVFEVNETTNWKYFQKCLLLLISSIREKLVNYLKKRKIQDYDAFIQKQELCSHWHALFCAPRSLKRSRQFLSSSR